MSGKQPRVLALYLEPAPYIVGLVEELRVAWSGTVDVVYASSSLTQDWQHELDPARDGVLPQGTRQALLDIRRRLRKERYSLLHLAGWGHPVLLGAMIYARARGIPVVVESDTGRRPTSVRWREFAKRLAYPILFRLPALFLPGGTRQAAYLRDYGVPQSRIRIAQMTVDVARMVAFREAFTKDLRAEARRALGVAEGDTLFLYVGRLEPVKGIRQLLDGFEEACRRRVDTVLAIVGDGSLTDEVNRCASTNAALRILGRRRGEPLWACFCAADVLVVPSISDAWGLVVNEAMAFGLPVIATNGVGCVDDLVTPGENGLVVEVGSSTGLTDAMETLVGNVDLRSRMGAESADRIAAWTLANEAGNICRSWSEVVGR